MPVYSRDYDRDNYDLAAPVVEITVSQTVPGEAIETLVALVDSGADASSLPIGVLERVGARFVESRSLRGITGHQVEVDTYLVTIRLGPHVIRGIQAIAMQEGDEAIAGRDLLNQLEVVLNGPASVVNVRE